MEKSKKLTEGNQLKPLTTLDKKYLQAIDIIIEHKLANSMRDISINLNFKHDAVYRTKSLGVSLNLLTATIEKYDLNANFFFHNDKTLFRKGNKINKPKTATLVNPTNSLSKIADLISDHLMLQTNLSILNTNKASDQKSAT